MSATTNVAVELSQLMSSIENILLGIFTSSVTACLVESWVEWQSNYMVSTIYLRLFMFSRLEYRVIIFGLIKCKLRSHLQEHAITMWCSHMPLLKQNENFTEHKWYDAYGFYAHSTGPVFYTVDMQHRPFFLITPHFLIGLHQLFSKAGATQEWVFMDPPT